MSRLGARLLAAQGWKEGQGLGKDGSGITTPVAASSQFGRAGIGFETFGQPTRLLPQLEPETEPGLEWTIQSNTVAISNLPPRAEPAYIAMYLRKNYDRDFEVNLCEIVMSDIGALVIFKDECAAEGFIDKCSHAVFSGNYTERKVTLFLVPKPQAEELRQQATLRLTDFWRQQKEALNTRTVLLSGLQASHIGSVLNKMFEEAFQDDEPDYIAGPNFQQTEFGAALVRFLSVDAATNFVSIYNGNYWKQGTIYAKCVEDSGIDSQLLPAKSQKKQGKLFVSNLPNGADKQFVLDLFPYFQVNDVHLVSGKNFAFIFLDEDAGDRLLASCPKGFVNTAQRRRVYVKVADKKGNRRKKTYEEDDLVI